MPEDLEPSAALVMKVGHHFSETWEQVVARKLEERDAAGVVFWGYGGSACHPTRQVQPFALASSEPVEVVIREPGIRGDGVALTAARVHPSRCDLPSLLGSTGWTLELAADHLDEDVLRRNRPGREGELRASFLTIIDTPFGVDLDLVD